MADKKENRFDFDAYFALPVESQDQVILYLEKEAGEEGRKIILKIMEEAQKRADEARRGAEADGKKAKILRKELDETKKEALTVYKNIQTLENKKRTIARQIDELQQKPSRKP